MADEIRRPNHERPTIELSEPMIRFNLGSGRIQYDVNTAKDLHVQLGRALDKYREWQKSQKGVANATDSTGAVTS